MLVSNGRAYGTRGFKSGAGREVYCAMTMGTFFVGGCLCIRVTMGQVGALKLMDISLEPAGPVWWVCSSSLVLFVSE